MLYVRCYSHALDVIVKHVCFKSIYLRDALSEIFAWSEILQSKHKLEEIPDQAWDALRDLVPFVQFKKVKKTPWRSVTFSTKSNTSS